MHIKLESKIVRTTIISILFVIAFGISNPYLTSLLLEKGFLKEEIAYFSSFGPLLLVLLAPIVGSISDNIGRKKTINISLFLMIFSYAVFISMGKNYFLLGISLLLSVAANEAIVSTLFARVEDNVDNNDRGKATGIYETLRTIGYLGGTATSAYLVSQFPISITFKLALYLLIFIFILGLLRKSNNHNHIEQKNFNVIYNIHEFLKNRNLRGMAIIGFGANFMVAPRSIFVPVLLIQELNARQSYIAFFAIAMGLAHLTQVYWGKFCDIKGSEKVIITSVIIWSLLFMGFYFAWSPLVVVILGFVSGLTAGAWNVAALCYLSKIGEKINHEGSVMGSYGSIAYFGVFSGLITSGYISQIMGTRNVFIFLGVICLFFALVSIKYLTEPSKLSY